MIVAVAAYADGKTPKPPVPLRYALQAQQYHALPEAGGLRDQPARLIQQMTACLNVYHAWTAHKRAPDKWDFQHHNPEAWAIVKEVYKWRARLK